MSRKMSSSELTRMRPNIGQEIRFRLAVLYAKETEGLKSWLTEKRVEDVRKVWQGKDEELARKLQMKLLSEEGFPALAKEAKDFAARTPNVEDWKIESHLRAQVIAGQSKKDEANVGNGKVKKAKLEDEQHQRVKVQIVPPKLPLKKDKNFQYKALTDRGRKDYVKSPNTLLRVAGCPPNLEDTKEGREMKFGNCCINSSKYNLQIVLQEGYKGLYNDLTEHLPPESPQFKMAKALLNSDGRCSLQSEQAKTDLALAEKEKVSAKFQEENVHEFKSWTKELKFETLKAKVQVCDDCDTAIDVTEEPNLSHEDFEYLTGAKTPSIVAYCDNCKTKTDHSLIYTLSHYGVYVDLSSQEFSKDEKNINNLLSPYPRKVQVAGQGVLDQILINTTEYYSSGGHQFCLKWNKNGQLTEVNDKDPGDWDKPFPGAEGDYEHNLRLCGIFYGKK